MHKTYMLNVCSVKSMVKGALLRVRKLLATESSLKIMKNASYFTLKAPFVMEIF